MAVMLAVKRSAHVAPEVNLGFSSLKFLDPLLEVLAIYWAVLKTAYMFEGLGEGNIADNVAAIDSNVPYL